MSEQIKVLDHGYIKLVEHWGSDERIIEAARMSTDKGFQGWGPKFQHLETCEFAAWCRNGAGGDDLLDDGPDCVCNLPSVPGDEKLLRFLYENNHATPFEMAGAIVEVQAPIFVFREWHRHRTQSFNELSARYTPLPDVNYVPTVERLLINSKTNKQAGTVADADALTDMVALGYIARLEETYAAQELLYQDALQCGVPKELARVHLPVGRYSRQRASANLRNWLAFLKLRMAPNAQWEIRQYANALYYILEPLFPRTMALFTEECGR